MCPRKVPEMRTQHQIHRAAFVRCSLNSRQHCQKTKPKCPEFVPEKVWKAIPAIRLCRLILVMRAPKMEKTLSSTTPAVKPGKYSWLHMGPAMDNASDIGVLLGLCSQMSERGAISQYHAAPHKPHVGHTRYGRVVDETPPTTPARWTKTMRPPRPGCRRRSCFHDSSFQLSTILFALQVGGLPLR